MLHIFHWNPRGVWVSPNGSRTKWKLGAWECIMCKSLLGFTEYWETSCPGLTESVGERSL